MQTQLSQTRFQQVKPKQVPANVSQLLQQSASPGHPSRQSMSSRLSMQSAQKLQQLQQLLAELPREAWQLPLQLQLPMLLVVVVVVPLQAVALWTWKKRAGLLGLLGYNLGMSICTPPSWGHLLPLGGQSTGGGLWQLMVIEVTHMR